MPAIVATSMGGAGPRTMTETTLNGTDTFTYEAGDILILRNPTGGTINPVLDGADSVSFPAPGLGMVSTNAGLTLAGGVTAGQSRVIPLDSVMGYLFGLVSILSGTGLVASILRRG